MSEVNIARRRLQSRDLQTASNMETTPEQLRDLSDHDDFQVRKAVASHPNTPPEVLKDLLPYHTQAVMNNPVLPLLRLENPTVVHDWVNASHPDGDVELDRKSSLANTTYPEILNALAHSGQLHGVHGALLHNEYLPTEAISKLAEYPFIDLHNQIVFHPNTSKKTLMKLASQDQLGHIRSQVKERLDAGDYKEESKSMYKNMKCILEELK